MSKSLIEHQMEINVIELTIWFDKKQPIKFINYSEALDCRGLDKKIKSIRVSIISRHMNQCLSISTSTWTSVQLYDFSSVSAFQFSLYPPPPPKTIQFFPSIFNTNFAGFFFLESWRFSLIHYFDITYGCKLKQTKPTKRFLLSIIHEKKSMEANEMYTAIRLYQKKKQKQSKQRNR